LHHARVRFQATQRLCLYTIYTEVKINAKRKERYLKPTQRALYDEMQRLMSLDTQREISGNAETIIHTTHRGAGLIAHTEMERSLLPI